MNFLKKAAFCYIAPLLTICSMTTTSLEAQCCDPCDPAPCIDWCSLLVPALVGAAAGAATAAAIKNRGKHGKRGHPGPIGERGERGENGPEGDNPFVRNRNEVLKFDFVLSNMEIGDTDSIRRGITPFVSTPEGYVTVGRSFEIDNITSPQFDSITISNPFFGTYTLGFQFTDHPTSISFDYALEVKATDHREDTAYRGTQVLSPSYDAVQFSFDYTYGPRGTVPEHGSSSSSSSS